MARVAFRGNFQYREQYPWSTETHLAATLEAMGHEVLRLQEDAVGWDVVRYVALGSDLFLWVKTWSLDPTGALRTLRELTRAGVPSVSYHLDLFFGTGRASQVATDPFFRASAVFTPDGGHDAEFAAAGVNHRYAPPGVYTAECGPGTPNAAYRADVAFVGSHPYPHPEWARQRSEVIRILQASFGPRFRLWKAGVRGRALNDLYATAKVVVGDSMLAGRVRGYHSDRIPETLGRGGFLIHPWVPGIEEHYTDGEHLRLYQHGDLFSLIALVRHYLDHEEERRTIARAGMGHVIANHTYTHRMAAMLEAVGIAPMPDLGPPALVGSEVGLLAPTAAAQL